MKKLIYFIIFSTGQLAYANSTILNRDSSSFLIKALLSLKNQEVFTIFFEENGSFHHYRKTLKITKKCDSVYYVSIFPKTGFVSVEGKRYSAPKEKIKIIKLNKKKLVNFTDFFYNLVIYEHQDQCSSNSIVKFIISFGYKKNAYTDVNCESENFNQLITQLTKNK